MTPVSLFTIGLGALAVAVGATTLLAPLRTRRGASALDRTAPEEQAPPRLDDGSHPSVGADSDGWSGNEADGDGRDDGGWNGEGSDGNRMDGETLVRGFTLTVLGLACLLWGVLGL